MYTEPPHKNPTRLVESLLGEMKIAAVTRDLAKMAKISDEITVFCSSYLVPTPVIDWPGMGIKLTNLEARMADRLFTKPGQVVSREMFMNAMYFDRPDGGPDSRIVDVKLVALRKKLRPIGYAVETHAGGYRGVVALGMVKKQEAIAA